MPSVYMVCRVRKKFQVTFFCKASCLKQQSPFFFNLVYYIVWRSFTKVNHIIPKGSQWPRPALGVTRLH